MDRSGAGSSTSPSTPSSGSRRSARGSPGSASPGELAGLGRRALRELAGRHGIRPTKALGQHFLADPNLARRIAALIHAEPGARILEVGAGLGSLTVALAARGAEVLAVELDRALVPALEEATAAHPDVRIVVGDAVRLDWGEVLGDGEWRMASNLPYNVAVPVVMRLLEEAPRIEDLVVMVQREVGERLVADPGTAAYGSVSVRVAYFAERRLLRRVPPSVFWPEPNVESVLVRLTPRKPPVSVARDRLFPVIEEGFAQRRKTMANALVRLGMARGEATALLESCGAGARTRAESLTLEQFACLAEGSPG